MDWQTMKAREEMIEAAREKIRRRRAAGETVQEIADSFGLRAATVYAWLRDDHPSGPGAWLRDDHPSGPGSLLAEQILGK